MHMQNVPMAMMHIEGVTPEWVFKCAKARGLPRVIHGKLETLHLNEDRAPVRPVPRPIVSFPVNRGGKSFQGTWARPEVIDEVVTCLHEFALDVSSRMGIPVSDMPNSDAGFASWWATKVRVINSPQANHSSSLAVRLSRRSCFARPRCWKKGASG
jgi:hypothetical protein